MAKHVNTIIKNTDAKRKQRAKTIAPKLSTIKNIKRKDGASMYSMHFVSPSQTIKGKKYKVTFRTNPTTPITSDNWGQFKLMKIPLIINCTCDDFKYRWEFVLNQHSEARIENIPIEFRYAPDITNPKYKESYCKHVIAAVDEAKKYLANKSYDQIRPSNVPTTGIKPQDVKDLLNW